MPSGPVSVPRSEAGPGTACYGQPVLLGMCVTTAALEMRVMAIGLSSMASACTYCCDPCQLVVGSVVSDSRAAENRSVSNTARPREG